ncbi:MAG TPA: carboxylesterase family protein [Vicinamibacterales bacterium]|nr:carboxylesterase family protein [Vicinamibacterales bacterium]
MRSAGILVACVLTAPLVTRDTSAQPACFVSTVSGDIQGAVGTESCTFLGIPYAAPPINALRWKAPQPAAPWAGTLPATTNPQSCPNVNTGSPSGVEDCLRLNVWVRHPRPVAPAPVIVWLHTGSFVAASANLASHNGRRLAEETGVIVVAPNYRLGPLGFLAHSALATEDPRGVSGNYGLQDQRRALEWVREHIAAFGGDPTNVTIAGTSAGGDSAGLHLVSPSSSGLFHRAIIESGTPTIKWPTHAESLAQGAALAAALGCLDAATVLTCLRSKTANQIVSAMPVGSQQVVETPTRAFWTPVVDGVELPDQPRALFAAGRFSAVPTIIGYTRDEAAGSFVTRSFAGGVSSAQYQAWVSTEFGSDAPAVLSRYPAAAFASPFDAMAQVVGEAQFACESRRLARFIDEARMPVFLFSYEYVIDDLSPDYVVHGVESNIIFGNAYAPMQFPNHPLTPADLALHGLMAGYWSRFAATGSPNVDDDTVVHWPLFKDPTGQGRGSNRFLIFNGGARADKRPREQACNFWEPYFLRTILGKVPAV